MTGGAGVANGARPDKGGNMTVNRILIMLAVDILRDRSRGVAVAGLIISTTKRAPHAEAQCLRDAAPPR